MTPCRTNSIADLRHILIFACALALSACGDHHPEDTRESLARDPERLKAVKEACHHDPKASDEKRCRAAADASFIRFMEHRPPDPLAAPQAASDSKSASPKF